MEQKPIKELKQQAQTDEQLQIKYERLTLDTKVNFFTKTEKQIMFRAKLKQLRHIFSEVEDDKKEIIDNIIQSVAFMTVELKNLEEVIKLNGQVERYKNGSCQSGYKRSAASDAYNSMKKTFIADIKLLTEQLNANSTQTTTSDELLAFIKSK
mgnify:CR=1 FL=1